MRSSIALAMPMLMMGMAGTAFSQKMTIVAFGDSTTALRENVVVYPTLLEKALMDKGRSVKVVNAGVPSNTTELARARFQTDVLTQQPDVVIIQFGLNDAAVDVWQKPPATQPRVSVDRYEENLRFFARTLKERGVGVILMTPNPARWTEEAKRMYGKPPYRPDDPDGFNVFVHRYADIVRKVAREEEVTLLDVCAAFQAHGKQPGRSTDDLLLDCEHPNSQGHRLIADLLLASEPLTTGLARRQAALAAGKGTALFEETLAVKMPRGVYGPRCTPGDLIVLKDGAMLMSFTPPDVYTPAASGIMGIKSIDQGKTWGQPFLLLAPPRPPAKGNILCPGFLRLPAGDILLSYIYSTYPTTPYYGHSYYRRSADEGKTWTDPFIMTPQPGYVLAYNNRLQILSTGRILVTAEYKAGQPGSGDHSNYVGMSFFSDDGGYSWQASKNTVDMQPIEVQEPDAVELKDRRIMMFARTYSGHPARAYSTDGGETWSKGELIQEVTMAAASGFPTVRRIPATRDLLFIWISEQAADRANPQIQRRCALTAAISKDEGRTFIHQRNIARDPEDDFGYQAVLFLGNDTAVITYHCRDGLRVARIGIDWFYGK
jgi:sialidase-1